MSSEPHMRPYALGIDPGIHGAVALFDLVTKDLVDIWDMPNLTNKKGKEEIDSYVLANHIRGYAQQIDYAVIENVNSMPDQGVASTFRFGEAKGILIGVLSAFNIPILKIHPTVWKPGLGLSADKKKSRDMAIREFPRHAHKFQRVKDTDRAEAALIIFFAQRFANAAK